MRILADWVCIDVTLGVRKYTMEYEEKIRSSDRTAVYNIGV